MFTGAHRRQIKLPFGKKVSSHGVHFVIVERTLTLIISGKICCRSFNRLYPAMKLHLSGFRLREDRVMETAGMLADNIGNGILPAGKRRTLLTIQLVLQLWGDYMEVVR
jgi:hypothetical protein